MFFWRWRFLLIDLYIGTRSDIFFVAAKLQQNFFESVSVFLVVLTELFAHTFLEQLKAVGAVPLLPR